MDEPASYFLTLLQNESMAHESVTLGGAILKLGAVLLLVIANGFFVSSEFALVSVRRPKLEARAAAGSKSARAALRLLDQPTIFISATQLGVTLASLALGWVGEPTVAALLLPVASSIATEGWAGYFAHGAAVVISFATITYPQNGLGEVIPKMMALQRAGRLALLAPGPPGPF